MKIQSVLLAVSLSLLSSVSPADDAITPAMRTMAEQLTKRALVSNTGYELIESLTTQVGPRLAGTEAEARAREWAVRQLKDMGFSNVRVEPFQVPVWRRGIEQATVISPYPQSLVVSTLGGSTSTAESGVEGQVVSFPSLAALRSSAAKDVSAKIVFIDEKMTRTQDGSGYSVASAKRRSAAYIAKEKGALAVLIRSAGTSGERFAHTGQMRGVAATDGENLGVPGAALAGPDADQLQRMLALGAEVRVNLVLTPQSYPAAQSGNVIAEIPGAHDSGEIVLVGAHLDSWDLGTGAVDDGAGVGIILGAGSILLEHLPRSPKRTIRFVLFGAEEVGLVGAKAYAKLHEPELDKHVIATESDFGAGRIWRFDGGVSNEKLSLVKDIGESLIPLGIAPGTNTATGGPDIYYLRAAGVPVVGLKQNGWDYFDVHHTANDTLDKIDPADIAHNVAAYSVFLYLAAEVDAHFR